MSKAARGEDIDIFDDDDLVRAQEAVLGATGQQAPVSSGEGDSPAQGVDTEPAEAAAKIVEPTDSNLRFRVRRSTRARFDAFKAELSIALGGVRLTDSNVGRAVMEWFLTTAGQRVLEAASHDVRVPRRPGSDDAEAMEAFDVALQEVIQAAVGRSAGES